MAPRWALRLVPGIWTPWLLVLGQAWAQVGAPGFQPGGAWPPVRGPGQHCQGLGAGSRGMQGAQGTGGVDSWHTSLGTARGAACPGPRACWACSRAGDPPKLPHTHLHHGSWVCPQPLPSSHAGCRAGAEGSRHMHAGGGAGRPRQRCVLPMQGWASSYQPRGVGKGGFNRAGLFPVLLPGSAQTSTATAAAGQDPVHLPELPVPAPALAGRAPGAGAWERGTWVFLGCCCMCVCVHVCVCAHEHMSACLSAHACVWGGVRVHACMCICVPVCRAGP